MSTFIPIDEVKRAKAAKKTRQAFYTPESLVALMLQHARLWEGCRVLEPSAGDGRIVHSLCEMGCEVFACELDEELYGRSESFGATMLGRDFLKVEPTPTFDAVVMNPPFQKNQAQEHIEHAYRFLKPYGQLTAIAPANFDVLMRDCKLSLPGCDCATCEAVDDGAFKESGTLIATTWLTIEGPGDDEECLGFRNHATANAWLTIETTRELAERCLGLDADKIRGAAGEEIVKCGGSCYGVDWQQIEEALQEKLIGL